jgi:hypothetical protein
VDNETNSEGASSKDGGKMKLGDKVWVLCLVLEVKNNSVLVCGNGNKSWWVRDKDCKPVEPEAVEQPTNRELTEAQKIAERTLKAIWATQPKPEPVIKDCSTTESGSVEAKYKIGDWVEIVGPKEPTELRRRWDERMDRYIGMIVEVRALSIPTKNDDALYNLSKCGFLVFREKYLKPASEPCKEKQSEPVNPSHYKQGGIEDLKKARWYLDRLIQEEETK